MTATNMCYNFVGFRYCPPLMAHASKPWYLTSAVLMAHASKPWYPTSAVLDGTYACSGDFDLQVEHLYCKC